LVLALNLISTLPSSKSLPATSGRTGGAFKFLKGEFGWRGIGVPGGVEKGPKGEGATCAKPVAVTKAARRARRVLMKLWG